MAARGEKEKRQTPTTASIPDAQLNAIERKKLVKAAEELYGSTHFTQEETECLLLAYRWLAGERMDRVKFRDLLHDHFSMSDDFFMDRVFRAFDKDSDGILNQQEWVNGMSIFLKGSLDEQMEYCFNIYDLNSDGYISREEMFQMLKTTMIRQPTEEDPDEGIKDLVEIMVKKMDHDNDQKVSLEDYTKTIRTEPLLIEAFGPCQPTRENVERFNQLVFHC